MDAEERELIRSCTSKIVASPLFANADRLRRFLLYCVEHVLKERTDRLKETLIGMEVFDRGSAFDPRDDSIVRVDARRLRLKLKEYYREYGVADGVEIVFTPGSYVPRFRFRQAPLIERWSVKFDWPARVAAYTAHLALVEREAIQAVARSKAPVWEKREQELRETEWAMHERAIAAAKRGLDAYMEKDKVYANLADIARMLEIASKLGRLATGLDKADDSKADEPQTLRVEVMVALEKIYSEPSPDEVVEVEEVKP